MSRRRGDLKAAPHSGLNKRYVARIADKVIRYGGEDGQRRKTWFGRADVRSGIQGQSKRFHTVHPRRGAKYVGQVKVFYIERPDGRQRRNGWAIGVTKEQLTYERHTMAYMKGVQEESREIARLFYQA